MSSGEPPLNPYESPREAFHARSPKFHAKDIQQIKLLRRFRQHCHALGGVWSSIGGIVFLFGLAVFANDEELKATGNENPVLTILLMAAGGTWTGLGVAVIWKQLWAVYLGLGLTYLAVLLNLFTCNLCVLVILAAMALQGHDVIWLASRLRHIGIPLTTRPEQLTMQVAPPPGQWPT